MASFNGTNRFVAAWPTKPLHKIATAIRDADWRDLDSPLPRRNGRLGSLSRRAPSQPDKVIERCRPLARLRHADRVGIRLLIGVDRKWLAKGQNATNDPMQTWHHAP